MEIKANTQSRSLPAGSNSSAVRSLQLGDLVHVTALTKVDHGVAIVRIGSTILTATSDTPLQPGQKLLLEVVATENPPILRAVSTANNSTATIEQALRSALPRQDGFAPLLANLIQVAHHKGTPPVPTLLVDAAQTFLSKLPSAIEISTADGLLKAFKNSGLFLEIRLRQEVGSNAEQSQNRDGFDRDLKVGLLKLYDSVLQSKAATNPNVNAQTVSIENLAAKVDVIQNLLNRIGTHIQQLQAKFTQVTPGNGSEPVASQKTPLPVQPAETVSATLLAGQVSVALRKYPRAGMKLLNAQLTLPTFTNVEPLAKSVIPPTQVPALRNLNYSLLTQILANVNVARKDFSQILAPATENNLSNPQILKSIQEFAQRLQELGQLLAQTAKQAGFTSETTILAQSLQRAARSLVVAAPTNTAATPFTGISPSNFSIEEQSNLQQKSHRAPSIELDGNEFLLPPSKTAIPQAQARASTTVIPQDPLARIITALLNNVESSLARQQLHQLASRSGDSEQQVWSFELPIRREQGVDVLQLRISRESNQGKDDQQHSKENMWCVQFALDLQELGPIQAKIAVAESTVSATLWVSNLRTVQLFQSHLHELEENLHRAGLTVNNVSVVKGQIQQTEASTQAETILDEHA